MLVRKMTIYMQALRLLMIFSDIYSAYSVSGTLLCVWYVFISLNNPKKPTREVLYLFYISDQIWNFFIDL